MEVNNIPADTTIMVIDDAKISRTIMEKLLSKKGFHRIITAESATEAFKILGINGHTGHMEQKNLPVDLIITDLMMPEINGIEFCKTVQTVKEYHHVPIIMVTASNEQGYLEEAFDAGVVDYITKPINPVELVARVRAALRLKKEIDQRKAKEQSLQYLLKSLFEEMETARQTQLSVLAKPLSADKIYIRGNYIPAATLGGDMYYWQQIEQDKYGVILLDVMGHGINTALISMFIRSLIPGIISRVQKPKLVVEELNRHMVSFNNCSRRELDYYFTAIYLLIDKKDHTITFVNSGHPPGLLFMEDHLYYLEKGSLPLGFFKKIVIEEEQIKYHGKAELLIYSDGLIETLGVHKEQMAQNREIIWHYLNNNASDIKQQSDDISYVLINLEN